MDLKDVAILASLVLSATSVLLSRRDKGEADRQRQWERIDDVARALGDHRLEAAKTYATRAETAEFRTSVGQHFEAINARLTTIGETLASWRGRT